MGGGADWRSSCSPFPRAGSDSGKWSWLQNMSFTYGSLLPALCWLLPERPLIGTSPQASDEGAMVPTYPGGARGLEWLNLWPLAFWLENLKPGPLIRSDDELALTCVWHRTGCPPMSATDLGCASQ